MTKETETSKVNETEAVGSLSAEDVEILQGAHLDLDEVLEHLTDLEKNYCKIVVTQNPKSKVEALKRAGSNANPKYLSKMAWEIEQRPHVQSYMHHLRTLVVEELGLSLQEVVSNARKGIELAFEMGKPKDADPHNRLLAELGGFIKNTSPQQASALNVKVENNLKGESLEADFLRLKQIAGIVE
jgi:hypothetical protein